jgi:hypothetical protein
MILLPQFPKCWGYRHMPSCLADWNYLFVSLVDCKLLENRGHWHSRPLVHTQSTEEELTRKFSELVNVIIKHVGYSLESHKLAVMLTFT